MTSSTDVLFHRLANWTHTVSVTTCGPSCWMMWSSGRHRRWLKWTKWRLWLVMERVSLHFLRLLMPFWQAFCKAEFGVSFRELVLVHGAHQCNVGSTVSVNCTDTVHVVLYWCAPCTIYDCLFIILLIMSYLTAHFRYLPCTVCKPCISPTSVTGPTVHCWHLSLPFIHLGLISVSLATLFETAVEPKGMIVMSVVPCGLNIWLDLCDESVDFSSVIRIVGSFP